MPNKQTKQNASQTKGKDDVVNLVEDVLDENDPFNDQIRT